MAAKKIIYYILAAFIAGTMALVYIQYNSSKNINRLINGNDRLLDELAVSNQLNSLEKSVLAAENNVAATVATEDSSYLQALASQLTTIETELGRLQKVSDNDSSVQYIDELDSIVH